MEGVEKTEVVLDCKASGIPAPKYEFYKVSCLLQLLNYPKRYTYLYVCVPALLVCIASLNISPHIHFIYCLQFGSWWTEGRCGELVVLRRSCPVLVVCEHIAMLLFLSPCDVSCRWGVAVRW